MTRDAADGDPLQAEILSFLEATLPAPVERVETHAAVVLLAGDRAFKMKRAVRYSFLDFSTAERRRRALLRELELNRRTAPELYLRVVAVVRRPDGSLALEGEGEPLEWLLEMRRFPDEARLDRVAARGGLTPALVEALAREIVHVQREAPVRPRAGGAAGLRRVIAGNAADLRALVPAVFPAAAVEELVAATDDAFDRMCALLERRREGGRVRHCHGDLHLGNIVLLDGRPVLFDCIEFDDELASIDVLYDLAFLVMDLLERQLGDAAWRLLQTWNDEVVDDAGLATLPLFLSVRAAIRAKVEGFAAGLEGNRERASRHLVAARTYLALARRLLCPRPPRLIALGGVSGTGKSSLARALAPRLGAAPGAIVLRTDMVRKRLFGLRPTQRLPETAYRAEISARVFGIVARRARILLEAGRTVICDGVYGEPVQRQRIEQVARELGVPFAAYWLEAPREVLERRVAARANDASDADVRVLRRQLDHIDTAAVTWRRVDAARPVEEVAADILRSLAGGDADDAGVNGSSA